MVILLIAVAVILTIVESIHPKRPLQSHFELERLGDDVALRRHGLLGGVSVLLDFIRGVLFVVTTMICLSLWPVVGAIVAIILLLVCMILSRIMFIHSRAMAIYESWEVKVLNIVESVALLKWLGNKNNTREVDQKIESVEHLLHLVKQSSSVLSTEQQELIRRGLRWHGKEVKKVMTVVDDIVTVRRTDLLGPLLLDDLHKSGHTRFPVITNGINNVVGQINIANLLEVDGSKKSPRAENIMTPVDVRLHEDVSLPEALRQLLEHPSQLGLVVDDDGKTVGLVALSDIITALLGKNRGGVIQ